MIYRILITVLISLSIITAFFKNIFMFGDSPHPYKYSLIATIYNAAWRAFINRSCVVNITERNKNRYEQTITIEKRIQ